MNFLTTRFVFSQLLLFGACRVLFAQIDHGVRVGGIWSSGNQPQANGYVTYLSSNLTWFAGYHSKFKISEKFTTGEGIEYEERRISFFLDGGAADDHLRYVSIPISIEYLFDDKLSVLTGIQPGFLISARTKINSTFGFFSVNSDFDSSGSLNRFRADFFFGLEYRVDKKALGFKYNFGLNDLNQPQNLFGKYKINGAYFYLSYFPFRSVATDE